MEKTLNKQTSNGVRTPMPPVQESKPLFMPLDFWLNLISYLDKRVEIVAVNSGYGVLEMSIKLQRGKIHEVEFQEKIRLREALEKAGNRGQVSLPKQEIPTSQT